MACIDIHNQAEYDAHKDDKDACLHLVDGEYTEISGSARVGSVGGSARVESVGGSARVGYVRDSASVGSVGGSASVGYVGDSASVGYVGGSASVRKAADTSTVHAHGQATVTAAGYVTVYQHSNAAKISGGRIIKIPETMTVTEWADFTGTPVVDDGHLVVFKAVDADLISGHGMKYEPGATVTAPDFNTVAECGNGLHFSPHPLLAASYLFADAKRFLACRVALGDVVVLDNTKVKARTCVVLYEVTPDGDRMPEPEPEVAAS